MADSDSKRKLEIYRTLYRLNRAFALLHENLDWLTTARILASQIPGNMPESWQDWLAETQAEINRRLTENLHNLEHGDVRRLGRALEMSEQIRDLHFGPAEPLPQSAGKQAVKPKYHRRGNKRTKRKPSAAA